MSRVCLAHAKGPGDDLLSSTLARLTFSGPLRQPRLTLAAYLDVHSSQSFLLGPSSRWSESRESETGPLSTPTSSLHYQTGIFSHRIHEAYNSSHSMASFIRW